VNPLRFHARGYAKKGWHVFPVTPDQKIPLPGSRGLLDATTDLRQIDAWWTQYPDANVAVNCGKSGLVVVDLDTKNGASVDELISEFGIAAIDTLTAETPSGGRHYVYAAGDATIASGANVLGPGLDIRANGGYIVVAPSSVNGKRYTWLEKQEPAQLPAVLVDAIGKARTERPRVSLDDAPIPNGQRHDEMFRISSLLRRAGMNAGNIYATLQLQNKRCSPPLPDAELRRMAENVERRYDPEPAPRPYSYARHTPQPAGRIHFAPADEGEIEPISWFWRDLIPKNEITLFEGEGGIGKSTVVFDLIARKSKGLAMPGGAPVAVGNSIVFASEDGASMIRARLQVAGADMKRVYIVSGVGDPARPFYLPDDVPALIDCIVETGADVVYFDSLFEHFAPGLAPKNPQDARTVMSSLSRMAHDQRVTAAGTRHWGKESRSAASRGLGATEIVNVARSVLAVARHPDLPDTYAIAPVKRNYGTAVRALTYRIESAQVYAKNGEPIRDEDGELFTVGRIVWGQSDALTADDLAMPRNESADDRAAGESADDFVRDFLAAGPRPAADVIAAAEKRNIAQRTLYRTKKRLGVVGTRAGFPAVATWALPDSPESSATSRDTSARTPLNGETGKTEHLRERECSLATTPLHTRAGGESEDDDPSGLLDYAREIGL